jgi:hypothetical protein
MNTPNFQTNKANAYRITTIQGVQNFFIYVLFELNIDININQKFEDYKTPTGSNLLCAEECHIYNKWLSDCKIFCEVTDTDIYSLLPGNTVPQPHMSASKKLPVYNISLCSTEINFSGFDGTEVHPIQDMGGGFAEQCEDEKEADYYTVFVHLIGKGLESIADCENKDDAVLLGKLLEHVASQTAERAQKRLERTQQLLKRSLFAFNQLPNKSFNGKDGRDSTYDIASAIGKYFRDIE